MDKLEKNYIFEAEDRRNNVIKYFCPYLKEDTTRFNYEITWLMLLRGIIAVYTENHTK
jgi:hypothetical protein